MNKKKQQGTFVIPFHGETISVIKEKDKGFLVPLKQFCDALNIRWDSQYKRIKEDLVLNSTVAVIATVAPDGKIRKTLTLPLEFLNGFLFTISDKRLKNKDTREKLILYKAWTRKLGLNTLIKDLP